MSRNAQTPRARISSESGFVLPAAVIVLLVLTLLTGAALTVSTQTSTSTFRDTNSKGALEAAEAGLQVAVYRLNLLKPESSQCINESAAVAPSAVSVESSLGGAGYCMEASAESIGNSESFQYSTTPGLAAGKKCAGETIVAKTGVTQRCVTAEGTVNGVKPWARLQERVESAVGESLFAIKGILGLEEVLVKGNVHATAIVASNTKIKGEGSAAFEKGYELCKPGTFTPAAGSERNRTGVTVGGVGGMSSNPTFEKERSATECPIEAKIPSVHATSTENEDSRIGVQDTFFTEGKTANKFTGAPTYQLTLSSQSKLVLAGSKYYFCSIVIERNGVLEIATGAKVEIFIDNHANNANCPTTAGTFSIGGSATVVNPNGSGNLLIEMAGGGPLTVENGSSLKASIFAPEAEVVLNGAGELKGAVVGRKIHLEAGSFIYSEESSVLTAGSSAASFERGGWDQCTAGGSTPEAGC
jgi:Tfp pilus assembly protein PilX